MTKLALLIGVSEYGAGFTPLPSAMEDVDALCRVLVDSERGEFLAENIKVLKNPDRQEMEEEIYWLFHDREADDLLLLYFSGHGIKDERNKFYLGTRITKKNDRGSLVPTSAVAATSLHDRIESSVSERQVIILDACYSGAIAKGMTVKDDGKVNVEDYLGGKGRAILTSSSAVDYAFSSETGLSIYTRYLVEGIATGAADLDEDDWISVDELHGYAAKKLRQAAPAMTPEFYQVQGGYKILLAKSRRDDPKLKYEREFQRRVEEGNGEFSIFVREILLIRQQEWGISSTEAKTIEDRVLQPHKEYREKLEKYTVILIRAVQKYYPFSDREQIDLKEYQQHLKLRDEDIAEIDRRILPHPRSTVWEEMLETRTPIPMFSPSAESIFKHSVIEFTSAKVNAQGEIVDKPKGKAEIFVEDLGHDILMTMVKIPGGEFLMGSPASEEGRFDRESPQHRVNVPKFYMGQTLVTQAQWQQLMGYNPSHFTGDGELPVEQVSWLDATEFCKKLSQHVQRIYRLPSEAEWEYACRARTTTTFSFGQTITGELANYNSEAVYRQETTVKKRGETTLVGEFSPNPFGLYDLHGNVCEWCLDHWHENYQGAPLDGSAWLSDDDNANRLLRGGSWDGTARYCRSATRFFITPVNRDIIIGFRVVCESICFEPHDSPIIQTTDDLIKNPLPGGVPEGRGG
jgi:formylglycine-generating enzyme required for sulfatase activity